ncbi:MAG: Uma2 family endonuclease [Planctomycetota bacterium]|nr:Uma2 family endonuclease [Planctomycetota bacterium]
MGLTAESKRFNPPTDRLVTGEELAEHPEWGRCELIEGRVVLLSPSGGRHGEIAGLILGELYGFVARNNLGRILAAETGLYLARDPDTVRAPDVAYYTQDQVPAGGLADGFLKIAPALVVEIISPSDRFSAVVDKVQQYLKAGVQVAWIVDPRTQTVHVYRKDQPVEVLQASGTLRDEALLPGWELPLAKVFGA